MPDPSSWNLVDEPFDNLDDWADYDNGDGVSEISPAGQLRTWADGTSASFANRGNDISIPAGDFTCEVRAYFDTIGTVGNNDMGRVEFYDGANAAMIAFSSANLHTYNGSYQDSGVAVAQDAWHVWRFLWDYSALTFNVYLDGILVASDLTAEYSYASHAGQVRVAMYGYATATEAHWDYIKVASGLYTPTTFIPQVTMF